MLLKLPVCVLSRFSHVWLFATPWTVARQAPLSMGFSRQEYWSGLPCPPPGDLPDPGIEPQSPASPASQADSLPLSHLGSPWSHLHVCTRHGAHMYPDCYRSSLRHMSAVFQVFSKMRKSFPPSSFWSALKEGRKYWKEGNIFKHLEFCQVLEDQKTLSVMDWIVDPTKDLSTS